MGDDVSDFGREIFSIFAEELNITVADVKAMTSLAMDMDDDIKTHGDMIALVSVVKSCKLMLTIVLGAGMLSKGDASVIAGFVSGIEAGVQRRVDNE